ANRDTILTLLKELSDDAACFGNLDVRRFASARRERLRAGTECRASATAVRQSRTGGSRFLGTISRDGERPSELQDREAQRVQGPEERRPRVLPGGVLA